MTEQTPTQRQPSTIDETRRNVVRRALEFAAHGHGELPPGFMADAVATLTGVLRDSEERLIAAVTAAESGSADHSRDFVGDGGLMPGDQWRDAVERALGVEPDSVNHTPAWAYERVLAKREIGNGVRDESGMVTSEAEQAMFDDACDPGESEQEDS
jgi:hypothetical protein